MDNIQIPDAELTEAFETLPPHEQDVATADVQSMMDFVSGYIEEEPQNQQIPPQEPVERETPPIDMRTLIPEEYIKDGKIDGKFPLTQEGLASALKARRELEKKMSRGEHKEVQQTPQRTTQSQQGLTYNDYQIDVATRQTMMQDREFREIMEDANLSRIPESPEEWRQLRKEDFTVWAATRQKYDSIKGELLEGLQEIETFHTSYDTRIDNVLEADLESIYDRMEKYFTVNTNIDAFNTQLKEDWKDFSSRKNDPSLWVSKYPGQEQALLKRGIDPFTPIPGAFSRFVESKHMTEIIERAARMERESLRQEMHRQFETRAMEQRRFDKSFSQIRTGGMGIETRLPSLEEWNNPDFIDHLAEENPNLLASYISRIAELSATDPELARKYQRGQL